MLCGTAQGLPNRSPVQTGAQETRLTYELFSCRRLWQRERETTTQKTFESFFCPRLWQRERETTTQEDFRVVLLPKTVAARTRDNNARRLSSRSSAQDCGNDATSEPISCPGLRAATATQNSYFRAVIPSDDDNAKKTTEPFWKTAGSGDDAQKKTISEPLRTATTTTQSDSVLLPKTAAATTQKNSVLFCARLLP